MTEKCGAVGALIVGGRVVGQIKCDLEARHDIGHDDVCYCGTSVDQHAGETHDPVPGPAATPHAMTLTWEPEQAADLDLFDPDESFDVDVPIVPPARSIFLDALGPKRAPMYGSSDDDGI